jgi:hypothetical protein
MTTESAGEATLRKQRVSNLLGEIKISPHALVGLSDIELKIVFR